LANDKKSEEGKKKRERKEGRGKKKGGRSKHMLTTVTARGERESSGRSDRVREKAVGLSRIPISLTRS